MSTKPGPFDELPDDILPDPLVPPSDLGFELDPKLLAEMQVDAPKARARMNKLLRRDLAKEVATLYKFLDSGEESSFLRVSSRKEGDSLRNKLYYARKQEEYRVYNLDYSPDATRQRDRQQALMNLSFMVDHFHPHGWLVVLYVQAPLILEPFDPESGIDPAHGQGNTATAKRRPQEKEPL